MSSFAPEGTADLVSRLRADLSQRWQLGERVRIESYLEQYPHLGSDPQGLLDLIYGEILLREERNESPALGEYLARFPDHADAIRRCWAVHRLIAGDTPDPQRTRSELRPLTDRPAADHDAAPHLPGYELLEMLGRGGMGVVYRARQIGLGRVVAVKMIREHRLASQELVTRFHTEAQAVGRLRHPHVITVHAFGEEQGCPWLAMEYLPGGSLAGLLRGGPLPPRRAAELAAQITLGVQAAHESHIIHRDLKPANVLLDEHGRPHVADFGLARLADATDGLTATGVVMGTPAYMSPEQADGRSAGVAADIWAVGIILYECLAGVPPFRGIDRHETFERVRTADPPPLTGRYPDIPAELELVCFKCLRKNPAERYASAAQLADDLGRFLHGERVAAKPPVPKSPGSPLRARGWLLALVGLLAVFALAATAITPEPTSTDAQTQLEARLSRRGPTELIGLGPPRWSRFVFGERSSSKKADEDGRFALMAEGLCLLELAPDPRRDRFRLRAQVRHLRASHGTASVGLYVGHGHPDPARQSPPLFASITFNDIVDEVKLHQQVEKKVGKKIPGGPRANTVRRRAEVAPPRDWEEGGSVPHTAPHIDRFQAHGRELGPWRTLSVEVSPEGVAVFWDAQRLPAGTLPATMFEQQLKRNLDSLNPRHPAFGLPARFMPRGGLGLYVERGSASFRNVVIEPLDP